MMDLCDVRRLAYIYLHFTLHQYKECYQMMHRCNGRYRPIGPLLSDN